MRSRKLLVRFLNVVMVLNNPCGITRYYHRGILRYCSFDQVLFLSRLGVTTTVNGIILALMSKLVLIIE